MESIINQQSQLMEAMNKLHINYKKDGPSRRSVQVIKNKLCSLDGYWQEFQTNHEKLLEFKAEGYTYFSEQHYEKTKSFYQEVRNVFINHLEIAEKGLIPSTIGDWASQSPKPIKSTPMSVESSEEGRSADGYQERMREPEAGPARYQVPREAAPEFTRRKVKLTSDSNKLQEMMRKQQSNFKAFARTIYYINVDSLNEQWELEDALQSIQSRWTAIDSFHWDIDSESCEEDEAYNQSFYNYEQKFQDIKKRINSKKWSISHREKATPQMEIPAFNGNFHQWVSFKDLFNEAIHSNRSMSNAQKMQFLKNKVRGEAEKLIQHLNISSENYEICWEILNHRYNNLKLIFSAHINNLLSIPSVQHQSYMQVKKLHDTTNECLNAIKNLGVDIKSWDPLIVHLLSQKLDTETHTEYIESLQKPRDLPKLKDFLNFLEIKFTSYESSRRKLDNPKPSPSESTKKSYYKSFGIKDQFQKNTENFKSSHYQKNNCPVCNNNHGIFHCDTFLGSKADAKRKIMSRLNLCKNCLYNHYNKDCFSEKRCRTCNEKHNTLVHEVFANAAKLETSLDTMNKRKISANVAQENNSIEILLATALIKIQSSDGSYHTLRALIDQGSQTSLITEKAVQLLQLPRQRSKGVVYGVGTKGNNCKGVVTITASALKSTYQFNFDAYIMNNIVNHLPNKSFYKQKWAYLEGISLADPDFNISRPIDLLLGADIYATIIQRGIIKESKHQPIAQQTKLGWILCGNVPSYHCNIIVNNIEDIQRFWNIEDIAEPSSLSTQDQFCLNAYNQTTFRRQSGKYVVRLPLKEDTSLGLSKNVAIAQFLQLERKFQKDKNLAVNYRSFINEYIEMGHMRDCTNDASTDSNAKNITSCYLPHHAVHRADSTTTSLRVVFNASAKTSNGLSLNDVMYSGPNLQQELFSLIIKWRQFEIAFTADVEKMFRMIELNKQDQQYQKIIWRDSPLEPLREYALTTVTYGTKAAPFLAMMTLKQLANDERHNYPEASKVIENSFYMDDLLHGSHDLETAKTLQRDLMTVMQSGGFFLRKWSSNRPELLEEVSKARDLQPAYEFRDQETTKTLGLRWHPQCDVFTFQLKIEPVTKSTEISKRELLSNISKVFDPLGWLSPVTTKLKLLFQKVILQKIHWDCQVPEDVKKEWQAISHDLQHIKDIKIPRWLNSHKNQSIELHGFCDASTKAYACVIYCRVINQGTQSLTPILVAAKSRLVPTNKNITLPRLELCAALLLSSLMETIKNVISEVNIQTFGWSDSTAVLGWIQGNPSKWKPFVTNRVLKITKVMPAESWNYIKSAENPADCASRGIKAEHLKHHSLWWKGPIWLISYNLNQEKTIYTTDEEIKIIKKSHAATYVHDNVISDILQKHSCITRATRIVAWILRVLPTRQQRPTYLTTNELRTARLMIIKHQQEIAFKDEINKLINNQNMDSKSNILNLKPFVDQNGMLRVGGRITNANISWDMRHPLIIPHKGHLTDILIDEAHKKTLHGGARLTLAQLRQNYWVLGGNRATKKRIRLCITCRKHKPERLSQIMGDLPESRSNPTRPFYNTGVDFTGFVNVKASKGRGIKLTKGYIAVFVCMATKAVHLELVSDLSSASFIAALRRMSARRGTPRHIFSDNGTNFVGANKILKMEYNEIKAALDETFFNTISEMNITWHFNAPSWPSAGGLWEAAVKSLKHHLCRVLGEQHLTFEEFSTLLAQIEACLNARPLCALSEDPDDLNFLTPSHFLSSGPMLHVIETERDERTRWRLTQKTFNDIWKRWQAEYLCQLQSRSKWRLPKTNIKVDDVVIIHEPNLPAGKWALGRVTETHPGNDGYTRVVSVKTKNGVIKRPISKLSILPVSEHQEDSEPLEKEKHDQDNKNNNIKETRKTNQSSVKGINIKTMVLMLLMLIISPGQCTYNISYFNNKQGVYFDKLSNMKLARDEWKLIVYYDIDPYWQGLELFSRYITHLENICHQNKNVPQCSVVLTQLHHGVSELTYYNSLLLGQRKAPIRKRRGLINGIGSIAHSLFGVLDEEFAQQYQKDIELIKTNEHHLAKLWKNQTSVIEAENNLLQRVDTAMAKQFKTFAQHLENQDKGTLQLSNQVQSLSEINDFTVSSIIANNILTNLKTIQNTLLDTITNVLYGKFNVHLLTPEQLKNELNIIAGQVSKDLSLPYENINTDLPRLYQIMKVRTRLNHQFLIFEVKIPLVNRETYEMYRLIPIPHQEGNEMISIVPISNHVAINIHKELFIPMTTQKCMDFDSTTLICPLQGPIYILKADDNLCVMDQVTNKCKTDTAVCSNRWLEISAINTYLFFCCNQCTTKIICDQDMAAEHLHGAGILNLRKNCIIKGDSFTIYSQQTPSSDVNIRADVPIFEIPAINNIVNLSLPMTNNEDHLNEYKDNEKLINSINRQIKQMKSEGVLADQVSYHDIHHYVAIYVVVAILLVLVALYVRRYVTLHRDSARVTSPPHLSPEAVFTQTRRLPAPPSSEASNLASGTRLATLDQAGVSHTITRRSSHEGDQQQQCGQHREVDSASSYATTRPTTTFKGFARVK